MKKWLNWITLVVIFSITCGFLANWQLSRRETKLASISLVKTNYAADPIQLSKIIDGSKLPLPEKTWRPVEVSGHYLPDGLLLVRNRPNDGQPGFEELVPFATTEFGIIYVSRGWLPSGSKQDYPDDVPVPSSEPTTIVGRLMLAEPVLSRTAPRGQIATVNPHLADQINVLDSRFENGYLRLVSESPLVGVKLKPMPSPGIEEGNNLSYALQWVLFALMSAMALIWRIRRDSQLSRGILPKSRIRHSDLDAAFEDETTKVK